MNRAISKCQIFRDKFQPNSAVRTLLANEKKIMDS